MPTGPKPTRNNPTAWRWIAMTLGRLAGVVSGCALLVDYVLTIAVSIGSAGDALWSFLPQTPAVAELKLPVEASLILALVLLNSRGVRESVVALLPIFLVCLGTHVIALAGGLLGHVSGIGPTLVSMRQGASHGLSTLGIGGMLLLFVHAYSLGGGTYTGIEAVSNGLPIMREPLVQTGQRTMIYMASSLAITAGGLLICYPLWHVTPLPGKTMNAVLFERLTSGVPGGTGFVILSLASEGALLVVAAQAGFIDGPRVLANMSIDSWMPHRFSVLSDRLTSQNGIVTMGVASLIALLYTRGDVRHLVVMYSINVFLTFSLSMFGMARRTVQTHARRTRWKGQVALFVFGFLLCAGILPTRASGPNLWGCPQRARELHPAHSRSTQVARESTDQPAKSLRSQTRPLLEGAGAASARTAQDLNDFAKALEVPVVLLAGQ